MSSQKNIVTSQINSISIEIAKKIKKKMQTSRHESGGESLSPSLKHCVKSWQNLVRLWKRQKLCDVVVNVRGRSFPCHSVVPASASPFFRRALAKKYDILNEGPSLNQEITIDFMTADLFGQILNFMYTADIVIDPNTVRSLLLAAGRLEMQIMVNAIMHKILTWEQKRMKLAKLNLQGDRNEKNSPQNRKQSFQKKWNSKEKPENECIYETISDDDDDDDDLDDQCFQRESLDAGYRNLTVTGLMEELRLQDDVVTMKRVRTYAARNFDKVSKLDSFLDASVHTMACLLDDERLNIDELCIFKALCRWLEAHHTHLVHTSYLLSKIRLRLFTPAQLTEHVESKDYIMGKKKSRVIVLEAFRYHCLHSQACDSDIEENNSLHHRLLPRKGLERNYDTDDEETDEDFETANSEDTERPKCAIEESACVSDFILLSGGIDVEKKSPSDGVYKFDERKNNWFRFARMPQPRNHHAAVCYNDVLYILGGSDPSLTGPGAEVCPLSSCHKLELGPLKWSKMDSMSLPRMSLQGVMFGNYIYAIGGQDDQQRILRETERFSIESGSWERAGSMATPRAGLTVCKYNKKLWAVGGYCHRTGMVLDGVEAYNEKRGEWEIMASLRFPRCFASATACKDHLYVFGGAWLDPEMGRNSFSSVYDVDVYNDGSRIWEGISALKIGRHDAGIATLGSRIYIIGGKHCDEGVIKNLDTVECFDVEKDDWIEGITVLPLPLLGPAVSYTC